MKARSRKRMLPLTAIAATFIWSCGVHALTPQELGILYRAHDASSERVARDYQRLRGIPEANLIGIDVPREAVIQPQALEGLRTNALERLPVRVRALLLVWTTPYAVGCMSVTTAFAVGYHPEYCEAGCGRTELSPLFDADTLDAAARAGWRPAMLFPSDDPAAAHALAERGLRADGSRPGGTVYLVETMDLARNVRAAAYQAIERTYGDRVRIRRIGAPDSSAADSAPSDVLAYFTGVARVPEIDRLHYLPGAAADHLTSIGGVLDQQHQTTALEWIRAGATASYGTVTEPCNHVGKFPSPLVFLGHYLVGETLLEAYWKSVAMPGQGLFVGEPLAAPFAPRGALGSAAGGRSWAQ